MFAYGFFRFNLQCRTCHTGYDENGVYPQGERFPGADLPPNHEVAYDDIGAHDIPIVTGKEKLSMLNASKVIDDYCKSAKYPLPNDEAKLRFAAARLPDVFSKGTKFENAAPLNI